MGVITPMAVGNPQPKAARHDSKYNEPESEQADRPSRLPEVMPGSIPGRGIEEWRQKNDKHDIGVQPDQRDTRYHTDA